MTLTTLYAFMRFAARIPNQKKTPAIPGDRRGQVFRAGCVRGGVRLAYGILVGAAAGAGAAAAVTIGALGRRAG